MNLNFNEVVVESRKKVKPRQEDFNLVKCVISNVELTTTKIPAVKQDGNPSTSEYVGCEMPRLAVEFKQIPSKTDPHERYFTFSIDVPATVNAEKQPRDKANVIRFFTEDVKKMLHISNAFKGLPGHTKVELPEVSLEGTPKQRIESVTKFYKELVKLINGSEEAPVWTNIPLYLKVVADYNSGTRLELPGFVGDGFLERVIPNVMPSIEIKPNETVVLQAKARNSKGSSGDQSSQVSDDVMSAVDDIMNNL